MLENLKTNDKPSWGGAREGSGRKPRLQYEARELFNEEIDKDWAYMTKFVRYHIRKGDKDMLKWAIEHRIGKAPQSMDIRAQAVVEDVSPEHAERVMEIARMLSEDLRKRKTVQ
jgi:hypothetical protein